MIIEIVVTTEGDRMWIVSLCAGDHQRKTIVMAVDYNRIGEL